ncbi:hypothetical protein PsalN5692_01295 [Piscirickettsia salmonis]|nr:hypothetical protein PsalN5692_01295 [Piscirickettsia salmonis]
MQNTYRGSDAYVIFLLGKITAENEPALVQLNVLKKNVDKLTINCEDVEKEPLLIDLKKRFESLYCYNQHLLKHLRAEQFSDLTLGRCYQGAYSNAVMLIDRIIAGDGLTNYLLSAKRELIQQQAFNFMLETGAAFPNIHSVNGFYNHVAASYNMQPITDSYADAQNFTEGDFNYFTQYLRDKTTPQVLVNLLRNQLVIPEEYNSQFMAEILPERMREDWILALYDSAGQAHDVERTGLLLLKLSLQELGFAEGFVKEIPASAASKVTFYQTDDDIFIQEFIEDEALGIERYVVRICKDSEKDYQLIKGCYENLKAWRLSLRGLPQNIILKLLNIYREDAFSLLEILIGQGDVIAEEHFHIVRDALKQLDFLKTQDSPGAFIFTLALQGNHQQIVRAIIERNETKKELLALKTADGTPALYLALENGSNFAIEVYIDALLRVNLSRADLCELLAAKNKYNISGLIVAAEKGHALAVAAYIRKVLSAGLTGAEVMRLLLSEYADVRSVFHLLMGNGYTDAVKVYVEEILNSTLNEKDKVTLLHACGFGERRSSLELAMTYGQHRNISVFCDFVVDSNLSNEAKKALLIENIDKHRLLNYALSYGNHQAVTAYIDGILRLNLNKDEKSKILFAAEENRLNCPPGLNIALENNQHETVTAYIEGIAKTKDLELIKDLLIATDLGLALSKGYSQTVAAYMQGVLALGLEAAEVKRLFAAKEALATVLSKGYGGAVKVYINTVLAAGLEQEDIKTLITTTGLASACRLGHSHAVVVYVTAVLNSNLSEKNKKDILMTADLDGNSWLYLELKYGNRDTVVNYIKVILASALSAESQQALITAGLQRALQVGDAQVIRTYVDVITQEGLGVQAYLAGSAEGVALSLYLALRNDHHEAITAYLDSLSSLGSSEGIVSILAAENQHGERGLAIALKCGKSAAVAAYIHGVAQLNLSVEDKCSLLFAETAEGIPGLQLAVMGNELQAAETYLNEVMKLDQAIQEKLFTTKNSEGDSALAIAFKKIINCPVSTCIINGIFQSKLDTSVKWKIIADAASQGVQGTG